MSNSLQLSTDFAEAVLAILRGAGEEIMDVYRSGDFEIEMKDEKSPLTLADRKSHEYIIERLAKLTPEIPIVSEEDLTPTQTGDRYWLVDPLDGTKEFIVQNGEFTVMAALMHNDKPVFGAIHAPDKKIDYYGGIDLPAVKIENGQTSHIQVGESLHDPLVIVGSRSHGDDDSYAFMSQLGEHELISMGSSFKFGLVADATADAYVRFHPSMEWDTAAGQALVEAAGGVMLSDDGSEFKYGKKDRLNGGFVIFNPLLPVKEYLEKTS